MKVIVTVELDNLPDDTNLEWVVDTIRCQVNEWLDFDCHPDDVHITLEPYQ